MQFRKFLSVLAGRWKSIALVTVIVLAAAAAVTALATPVYTGQAKVYLSAEANSSSSESGTYVLTADDLNTYVSIVNTPAVLDPLREELGFEPGHPIDVTAEIAGTTSILTITARADDAQEAADVANEVGPQLGEVAGEFSILLNASGQQVVSTPIQPATPPGSPTSPNPVRNLLLALLTGLALGVGLALLRDALDTKVREEEDIREATTAPLLASIPMAKKSGKRALVSLDQDPHGRHAEAIRRLRTNLLFVDVTTGRHSFVVTSAMPGEGKTTTAINLALAMADSGTRTLLVDADLRAPSVAGSLGLPDEAGLTSILLGKAELADVVHEIGDSGLHVLPAGAVPPNPSELLGSAPMADLFARLSADYDFLIVDSPPVVPVVDAVILGGLTGGLLMVVGSGTRKRDLAAAIKQLTTVGAPVAGVAHNFVASKRGDEGRYGYYRYVEPSRSRRGRGRSAAKTR